MSLILSGTDGLSDVDGSAATPAIRGTDANTGIFFPAADTAAISTGGSERMRVDSSGNVGIGTTSPSTKLDVRQSSASDLQLQLYNNNAGVYATTIKLNSDNTTGSYFNAIQSYNGATAQWQIGGGGSSSTIVFGTGSSLTERMRITSAGNVGIGNTSPASALTVGTTSYSQAASVAQVNGASIPTGNAAGIFNIGSTDAAAADVGGSLGFTANGGVSGYPTGQISCRRDSATSSVYSTYLAFTTCSSGGTLTEKMRIDTSGNLLINTTSLSAVGSRISVKGSAVVWGCGPTSGNDSFFVYNASSVGVYLGNGSTAWSSSSDERIKTAITPFENALEKVCTLRAGTGRYLTDEESVSRSFLIAQDVQAVLPEAINVQDDEIGTLGLQYTDVIPLLVAAIKEQQALIQSLTTRITALETP